MTSSANEEIGVVDINTGFIRAIQCTVSNGLANSSYRQLQCMAKTFGVPSNLKKDILKRVIKAKVNGRNEEGEMILKHSQEARLCKRRQKGKGNEKSKNVLNSEFDEEVNNKRKVTKDILKSFIKARVKGRNEEGEVILKHSQETRLCKRRQKGKGNEKSKNVINSEFDEEGKNKRKVRKDILKRVVKAKVNDRNEEGEVILKQVQEARLHQRRQNGKAKEKSKNVVNSEFDEEGLNIRKVRRETLLQQYQKNPAHNDHCQRVVDNSCWTGRMEGHHTNLVSADYENVQNYPNKPYNNHSQLYSNIKSCNNYQLSYNTPQKNEIACYQLIPNSFQATHHYGSSLYGTIQRGMQSTSTPLDFDEWFGGIEATNTKTSSSNAEACMELQAPYPSLNRDSLCNVPHQNQLPPHMEFINRVSPSVTDETNIPLESENMSPSLTDVTNILLESENNLDTGLRLLANVAMSITQEDIDQIRRQQHNNGSLYGTIQQGMQSTSTPFDFDEWFGGIEATNTKTSSSNAEACMELQAPYPSLNRDSLCNVPHQNQLPPHMEFINRVSPSVTDVNNVPLESENMSPSATNVTNILLESENMSPSVSDVTNILLESENMSPSVSDVTNILLESENMSPSVSDVTNILLESENNLDSGLRLLANVAMSKMQEVIDQTRSSLYGTIQQGMQSTSTPFDFDEWFGGIEATNTKTSSSNAEACMELQAPYPSLNRDSLCNVPHQNQLPPHMEFINRVSPSVTDVTNIPLESENMSPSLTDVTNILLESENMSPSVSDLTNILLESENMSPSVSDVTNILLESENMSPSVSDVTNILLESENMSPSVSDVTNILLESENNLDSGLRLLANVAMSKMQEVIEQIRRQQHNNGLLMDLSPAVAIQPAVVLCKHGCHTASNSREQQLEHEQHCFQQPIECPMIACDFTSTLSFLSTHILNDHNFDVICLGDGSFAIDFTDGRQCSFEANCFSKEFCFPRLFNGRLFLIKIIGNFQSMQLIIYVQYINDHHNWKSYVTCEVNRPGGLPYQWTGNVLQLTDDPSQLILDYNCLIFDMNVVDYAQNLFVLHTSIFNKEIAKNE